MNTETINTAILALHYWRDHIVFDGEFAPDAADQQVSEINAALDDLSTPAPTDILSTLEDALIEWQETLNSSSHIYIVENLEQTTEAINAALAWLHAVRELTP